MITGYVNRGVLRIDLPHPLKHTAGLCHTLKPAVMSHNGNGLAISRAASSLAGSFVHRLTHAAAWVLSQFRELNHHHLTLDECEKRGLPEGSTEPHIYCRQYTGMPWWRVDAWSDGDCLYIDALGWSGEVHYIPKAREEAGAA